VSVKPLDLAFVSEGIAASLARDLGEPDWLRDERVAAARLVVELPAETNPLFTPYLDLRGARFEEIAVYPRSGVAPNSEGDLPEGAAAFLHVRENALVERAVSPVARDAGLFLGTFEEALADRPDVLRSVIDGGASLPDNDAFAQVARAVSTLGLLIHVPEGLSLAAPIVIRWDLGTAGRGLVSRTVVSLGRGAHASILEVQGDADARENEGHQSLWWGTCEVHLAEGASLSVAAEQDFDASTIAIVNRHARMERDASLQLALASVGARLHKSRIDNLLIGQGSSVHQVEIGFGSGDQIFDLTSYTRHIGTDTTGDLLSKGVFTDRSRGIIKGLIEIRRSATGTDSFLGEFGMLLARKARSVTIPSLEIDQPDVRRAAHSSSVAPIDEGQIFYLMSRGLDRETARKFIVMGFLEPVVARIPLPAAQDRLRELLERKWPASAGPAASAAA
jgi:Fe-S cluster assembly scaffold protein SufB